MLETGGAVRRVSSVWLLPPFRSRLEVLCGVAFCELRVTGPLPRDVCTIFIVGRMSSAVAMPTVVILDV